MKATGKRYWDVRKQNLCKRKREWLLISWQKNNYLSDITMKWHMKFMLRLVLIQIADMPHEMYISSKFVLSNCSDHLQKTQLVNVVWIDSIITDSLYKAPIHNIELPNQQGFNSLKEMRPQRSLNQKHQMIKAIIHSIHNLLSIHDDD